MSYARRLCSFLLLASGIVGCHRVESVTSVDEPTKAVVPSAFNGSNAGDEREVAGIKLCWCPPGKFVMGSPSDEPERRPDEDQVEVTLTKGFWMAKYEATQGQWKQVIGKLPGELTAELPEGDNYPVGNVNFAEAEAFCQKLTEIGHQSGDLPKNWEFRLPTEAQWEYACRAGTTTATSFGDKLSSKQANFRGKPYNGAEPGPSLGRAAAVGSYPANAWGLHDMHGNIFEWCRDWYHAKLPGGGLVAFYEPGLMNKKVFFGVSSHGYEFPPDGFGVRGMILETKPGGSARIKIKRINIAERLYRITGQGIYRDTVLLGRKPPIDHPLLNAEVTGQDGVLNAIYRGKLYWFYGDTNRLSYALGNFSMTGATTDLPQAIDPSVGFNLKYFTGKDGFVRPVAPMKGEGVVWLFGLVVLPDESGRERMLAFYQRRRGLGAVLENGFVVYNDEKQMFEKLKEATLDPPTFPRGYPLSAKDRDGTDYLYFTAPYPALRVKADWKSYLDLGSYESYTCLKPGTRYAGKKQTRLDRDAGGHLVWSWKKNTPPLNSKEQEELIAAGQMKRDESPFRLQDANGAKPILLNNCSCCWNDYRKHYIMIASESFGATMLGEVWYSEADCLEGPWVQARKIIKHANKKGDAHDFYNPVHHPFFDQDGGRVIYLEGSYVNTFSGNPHPTPYYEYNQIMYRLDLSDPRLKLVSDAKKK